MANSTSMNTGKVRFSYPNVFTPRAAGAGQSEKYSLTALIPKTDKETKAKIDAIIKSIYEEKKNSMFKGLLLEELQTPIHDGDGRKPKGGAYGEECHGCWVLSTSSKNKPGVVGPDRTADGKPAPCTDQTKVYPGCFGRVNVNFYAYDVSGNKGIAAGLNGVYTMGYGDPIDGRVRAEDAFNDGFNDEDDEDLGL